jgi:type VI secretion system secreted protein Hcp
LNFDLQDCNKFYELKQRLNFIFNQQKAPLEKDFIFYPPLAYVINNNYLKVLKYFIMALNAYLKLTGKKQGDITGSVTQKGREGKIMVIAVNHEVASPGDAGSGQATGKRQHKPFVITKELDKSTPLLFNALINNEVIVTWELQFFTSQAKGGAGSGTETNHYTVRLTNANITDIKSIMLNNKHPEFAKLAEYEEVAFTYQKIEWTWVNGGITASDDWEIQNV